MKRTVFLLLTVILLFACAKEGTQTDLKFLAGTNDGMDVNYSGIINDTLYFYYSSSSSYRIIDLNGDGVDDFKLMFSGSASPGHDNSNNSISTLGNSYFALSEVAGNLVDTIPQYKPIDAELNWANGNSVIHNHSWNLLNGSSTTGLWNNVRDKYIGTKIIVDGEEVFGWIRVELTNGWNLTLVDYACKVE